MKQKENKNLIDKIKIHKNTRIRKCFAEAKDYFKKGNFLILAIGFISGLIFRDVINSLANDIILGAINSIYNVNSSGIKDLAWEKIAYGKFLAALLNFVITGFILFVVLVIYFLIKSFVTDYRNRHKAEEDKTISKPTVEEQILEQLKQINEKLNKE